MKVLFVVSRAKKAETVFRLAEKMSDGGRRIILLFTGEASHYATDAELVKYLHFAEGIYALKVEGMSGGLPSDFPEGVEPTDYSGWVELLEACDRVVSWT